MRGRRILIAAAAALLLGACQKNQKAVVPEVFRVKFTTTQGDFVVEATRAWAPRGVDRFHELVNMRYFDENRFFRVVPGFVAQVHTEFTSTGDLLMPCHEYCGLGHSQMVATVKVVPRDQFRPDAQGRAYCGDRR